MKMRIGPAKTLFCIVTFWYTLTGPFVCHPPQVYLLRIAPQHESTFCSSIK